MARLLGVSSGRELRLRWRAQNDSTETEGALALAQMLTAADRRIVSFSLPEDLDTPRVVIDLDRVETNLRRMQEGLGARGVRLRPHTKTHKSTRFALMQLEAGATGLTTAVLGEAEVLAEAGFDDVFVAYPIWAVGEKARRLRALHDRISLTVGADSIDGAAALGHAIKGSVKRLQVLVEIDSGEERTGVRPEEAVEVAKVADAAGCDVAGVFTHAGHSYRSPEGVDEAAQEEASAVERAARALQSAGFDVRTISAGSTPTALRSAVSPVTEERPGTYIFGDRQQANLGGSDATTIALVVAATVVSTARSGGFVIDAGAKALSKDLPAWLAGHGVIPAYPHGIITSAYDHHGVVDLPPGAAKPSVGDVVAVVPNHVCPVVNLTNEMVIVRGGSVVDVWPVDARGLCS